MFDNISAKLKVLAKVVFIVGILASCASGIVVYCLDFDFLFFLIGLGTAVGGSALFWVWGALIYGFGELIENTSYLKKGSEDSRELISSSTTAAKPSDIKPLAAGSAWECPKCGKLHEKYETSCNCGYNKNRPQG